MDPMEVALVAAFEAGRAAQAPTADAAVLAALANHARATAESVAEVLAVLQAIAGNQEAELRAWRQLFNLYRTDAAPTPDQPADKKPCGCHEVKP